MQIKARRIYNLTSLDPAVEPEPVRVIRVEGDRAIVKFLTGHSGRASVAVEYLRVAE